MYKFRGRLEKKNVRNFSLIRIKFFSFSNWRQRKTNMDWSIKSLFWIKCSRCGRYYLLIRLLNIQIELFLKSLSHHCQQENRIWLIHHHLRMKQILVHRNDEIRSMILPIEWFEILFSSNRIQHHQQTLKEMREVLRCLEVNQHDFVETIDVNSQIHFLILFFTWIFLISVNTW